MTGFIQFDAEPEQYLFTYMLRPGNAPAKLGAIGILRRVPERLRAGTHNSCANRQKAFPG